MLESIMIARSSGCEVSGSNLSIFCSTPSSKSWKASLGKSGAGRFFSSSTLTSTLTRFTLTRMRPRWAAASCDSSFEAAGVGWTVFPGSPSGAEVGDAVDVDVLPGLEVGLPLAVDLDFCAHGGRSGLSWLNATPADRGTKTAKHREAGGRKGVTGIRN